MNDHLLITQDITDGELPKGEPIASPKAEDSRVCDPRELMATEAVPREAVVEGDFIMAGGWSKPRLVEMVENPGGGFAVLFLAEHDESRTNAHGIRRVDAAEWNKRSGWVRFPNLRLVWNAAHGAE